VKAVFAKLDTLTASAVADLPRRYLRATVRTSFVSFPGMSARTAPTIEDDRHLVAAVLNGKPGAFEQLVARFQGLCWHIVSRMVRDREDARDLCQEAFLRIYRHLHQYRFESPLRAWIGRVAYSTALRHLERKRIPLVAPLPGDDTVARAMQAPDDFDLETASVDAELMAALHAAIQELAPLQRTILTLYYLDELPIGDLVRITGIAEGTIKSHLFRSRAKLRERLAAFVRT
jgi:RNA polymerase sigma-70 factor (ECF subfamily)